MHAKNATNRVAGHLLSTRFVLHRQPFAAHCVWITGEHLVPFLRDYHMRKLILASVATAAFALTACSQETQEAAEATAESAADDAAGAADAAADAAGEAADATAEAAEEATDAATKAADEAAGEAAQAVDGAAEAVAEKADEEDKEDAAGK